MITKQAKHLLGKHNDSKSSDFNKKQLAMGIKVEREHTDDDDIAEAIAKDHLAEIPDYYTRLAKMEAQAKDEGKFNDN